MKQPNSVFHHPTLPWCRYWHTLPFLLLRSRVPRVLALASLAGIEVRLSWRCQWVLVDYWAWLVPAGHHQPGREAVVEAALLGCMLGLPASRHGTPLSWPITLLAFIPCPLPTGSWFTMCIRPAPGPRRCCMPCTLCS